MLDLLMRRRSIRKFQERKVERAAIEQLVKAMLLSPSSRNINPWEFILVEDKDSLEKLAAAKEHGSTFLKNAPMGVVVIADGTKSDVWVEDTSIASIIIQLTAEDLGLGSCWIQIRNRITASGQTSEEYVKELLDMPQHYKVEAIVALGYPDEQRAPHNEDNLQFEKVHVNRFNNPWARG